MLLTLINEKIFQQNTECDRLIKTRSRDLITGFRKDLLHNKIELESLFLQDLLITIHN